MAKFKRVFGYAIADERTEELNANGVEPELVLMAARGAYPEFTPYAVPFSRLMNQKSIGSCQGASLSHICQLMVYQQIDFQCQFSAMQAYIESQKIDGIRGDRGSTLAGGQRLAGDEGICLERDWPYPNPVRYNSREPQGYDDAPRVIMTASKVINDADLAWDLLKAGAALHIGSNWGSSQEKEICTDYRGGSGGHARFIYGMKEDPRYPDGLAWHQNSWGPGWCDNGRNLYAKSMLASEMGHRYTVVIAYQPTDLQIDPQIIEMGQPPEQ